MTSKKDNQPMIKVEIIGKGNYTFVSGTKAKEIVISLFSDHELPITGVFINNSMQDLNYVLQEGDQFQVIDLGSESGARIYRRTALFLLIKVCRDLFPDRTVMVRHSLSNGLYVEFRNHEVTDEEVTMIQEKMQKIAAQDLPINRIVVDKEKALQIFTHQGQMDLVELLKQREKEAVHIYELDGFYEYFYGYMLTSTGEIDRFRLICYPPGIIMQTPEKKNPGVLSPFIEQKKLASIFSEAKAWAEMLNAPHVAAVNNIVDQGEINDFIRVNEALHEKKIAYIADQICNNQNVRIILIAGPSSSGKTTFAQRLFIQLRVNGKKPVAISLDNYFVDRCDTPLDENNEYDFESIDALKLDLFNEHLQKLIDGEEVEMPVYNFIKGTVEEECIKIRLGPGQPLILEGIHCLNDRLTSSIPAQQKYKIYISALTQLNIDYSNNISTTDSRLIRRIIRDNRTRGYSALNTIKRWPSVRRGEEKNIFPFQENADIMFNSSLVYELFVLKPYIEPLLLQIGPENSEYAEARRLLKFLSFFRTVQTDEIPINSILREFVGNSCFEH